VVVVYNPRSGRGLASGEARAFAGALSRHGHDTDLMEAGADLASGARGAGAVVVAGGDGTLHHAAAQLVEAIRAGELDEPPGLYHVPLGTENLFARQFGMTGDPDRLHRALSAGKTVAIDVGICNGRAFVLMCGIGPDAGVLARLNAGASKNGRRGPISHRSYLGPILAELLTMQTPTLTVSVDGAPVVAGRRGLLIVGNSRQYAMRFDPAVKASMSDGLLDAVFMPARWRVSMIGWALAARLGCHTRLGSLVYRTGTRIEVSTGGRATPYQLDGEAFASIDGVFSITIMPGALRVWTL
jgi:diacylglycerol kinase family enzyme